MSKKQRTQSTSRSLAIVRKFFPGVGEIRDGRGDVEVEVTKRDVTTARKADHGGCAMAIACARATKADGMVVSIATAYVIKGKVAFRYRVPPSVSREITAFDRGAAFEPGQYLLKEPCASLALGNPRHERGGHSKGTNGNGAKPPNHLTEGIRAVLQGEKKRRQA